MKRNIVVLLCVLVSSLLVGCHTGMDPSPQDPPTDDPINNPIDDSDETQRISVPAKTTPFLSARLISGDGEFYGNGPNVGIDVAVFAEGTKVVADITVEFRETGAPGGNNTIAEVSERFTLFQDSSGKAVTDIIGLPEANSTYRWLQQSLTIHTRDFHDKVFTRLQIVGDTIGGDIGKTGIKIWFPEFEVVVE